MKIKHLFYSLLLSHIACAQDMWTPIANFPPFMGRTGQVSFSTGGKGYIGFGLETCPASCIFKNDLWEYDSSSGAWSQKASCPGAAREWAVGFSIGSKGYVCSGRTNWTVFLSDLWEYDPLLNSWLQKASLPAGGRYQAFGFSIGNKGYIGAGVNDTPSFFLDFWEYDSGSDSWTQKANFAGGTRQLATCFAIGNKGYAGLGLNNTSDFWEYDPSTDIWMQKASFPDSFHLYGVWFAIGNKGYFGTGSTGNTGSVDFWEYDPTADTWTQRANFPQQRRLCVGFSIGNAGYLGTGLYWNIYQPTLWKYSPLVTGVESWEINNSISVYPNPSTGIFTLSFPSSITHLPSSITIYNTIGEKVFNQQFNNLTIQQIDLTSQPKGIYFIKIIAEDKSYSQKIIIQ